VLQVDPTVNSYGSGPDCYKVDGGKLAPSKHVIDRIGAALGVTWDPVASGRTDDRTQLYYWTYRAVGHYRQYDGSAVTIQNEYEWDCREDSPRIEELREKAAGDKAKLAKLDGNIRQMRKFGLARAVTGARLRALSDVGFKRSYTPEELAKPFVIARVHFDGRTDDPEERKIFAAQTAASFLGGMQAMYPAARALPAPASASASARHDEEPLDVDGYTEPGEDLDDDEQEPERVFLMPDGPSKGKPITEATDYDLKCTVLMLRQDKAEPELCDAIVDELARREKY
jgi:hypothetical protein